MSRKVSLDQAFDMLSKSPEIALRVAENHLESDPTNERAHQIRHYAYWYMEDWTNALSAANESVKINPFSECNYVDRCRANYKVGKYAEALADAQKILHLDKDNYFASFAHRAAAMSYAAMGDVPNMLKMCHDIPELESGEWFPPIEPLPSGTKAEFTATMERMAHQVRDEQK